MRLRCKMAHGAILSCFQIHAWFFTVRYGLTWVESPRDLPWIGRRSGLRNSVQYALSSTRGVICEFWGAKPSEFGWVRHPVIALLQSWNWQMAVRLVRAAWQRMHGMTLRLRARIWMPCCEGPPRQGVLPVLLLNIA